MTLSSSFVEFWKAYIKLEKMLTKNLKHMNKICEYKIVLKRDDLCHGTKHLTSLACTDSFEIFSSQLN